MWCGPWYFPCGDIGRLAVISTVNDLAMVCARCPLALSLALIPGEEGLAMAMASAHMAGPSGHSGCGVRRSGW